MCIEPNQWKFHSKKVNEFPIALHSLQWQKRHQCCCQFIKTGGTGKNGNEGMQTGSEKSNGVISDLQPFLTNKLSVNWEGKTCTRQAQAQGRRSSRRAHHPSPVIARCLCAGFIRLLWLIAVRPGPVKSKHPPFSIKRASARTKNRAAPSRVTTTLAHTWAWWVAFSAH